MGFKNEKELAILAVAMVIFMALQTLFILHVDHRVDAVMQEQNEFHKELDGMVFKNANRAKHKSKVYVADRITKKISGIELPEEAEETSDGIGYDFELMCSVITAEGGTDKEVCLAVAQCLLNTCEKHGWRYDPTEMMEMYQYATPADWVSDEARDACVEVFLNGGTYSAVGDATLFYAPRYCDSEWHEQQDFVCEINGVRFFKENG